MKSTAAESAFGGNCGSDERIALNMRDLFGLSKGVAPNKISYVKMPSDHQSTIHVYGKRFNISGARYSFVPQKLVVASMKETSFDNPKSASLTWPSSARRTFSVFKSR